MSRPKAVDIVADAFFDNFTLAALFGKLRIPGAPIAAVDPRGLIEFTNDELDQAIEDIQSEAERLTAIVSSDSARGGLVSSEAFRTMFETSLQSSLKPLENLHR